MNARFGLSVLFFVVLLAAIPVLTNAQDEDESQGVKRYGVVHNIAPDRQVVNVGGIYEPEGLDIYLKRQLDRVDSRLGSIESKLSKLEDDVRALSERSKGRADQQGSRAGLIRD